MNLFSLINAFDWNEISNLTILSRNGKLLQTVTDKNAVHDDYKGYAVDRVHFDYTSPKTTALTATIACL